MPEDNGGSPIMGYIVEHRPQYETVWSRHETRNTSFLIPDLNTGWTYEIRVLAFTAITEGVPSNIVSVLLGSAPYRPQSLKTIEADRSALLKWSPPYKTGIPLEGFRIYMNKEPLSNRILKHNLINVAIPQGFPVRLHRVSFST